MALWCASLCLRVLAVRFLWLRLCRAVYFVVVVLPVAGLAQYFRIGFTIPLPEGQHHIHRMMTPLPRAKCRLCTGERAERSPECRESIVTAASATSSCLFYSKIAIFPRHYFTRLNIPDPWPAPIRPRRASVAKLINPPSWTWPSTWRMKTTKVAWPRGAGSLWECCRFGDLCDYPDTLFFKLGQAFRLSSFLC
jgi:hypothetical protein